MAGLEEQLNQILSDPAAMGQIAALAKSLGVGGEPSQPGERAAPPPPPAPAEWPAPAEGQAAPAAAPAAPQLDPRLLRLGSRLLAEYQRPDQKGAALLAALRPFVKPARYARLDRAIQIARLSRVIRVAMTALREGGETGDV